MRHLSFTMVELIVVIVVGGILSIIVLPRLERDNLQIATNQVIRHIQYTQHLAMIDDLYDDSNATWHKAMWRISFRSNNCYVVSSNTDHNSNYDRTESATDPLTKTLLYSNTDCLQESSDNSDMFLSDKYAIDSIEFNSACGNNRFIAFDYLGRPHRTLGTANDLMIGECKITLHSGSRDGVISISQETGYVKVASID
ncbi:MAG: type II secretion system GspH family protein [Thiovulaceae bacterium]|nr:type II secretion system GspH family protein [Sulfurimonadaceae bacterium]